MFQTIQYITRINNNYTYNLIDSEFDAEIVVPVYGAFDIHLGEAVMAEYKRRQVNNDLIIVHYYKWLLSKTGSKLKYVVDSNFRMYPEDSKKFYSKYLKHLCRALI